MQGDTLEACHAMAGRMRAGPARPAVQRGHSSAASSQVLDVRRGVTFESSLYLPVRLSTAGQGLQPASAAAPGQARCHLTPGR
jgi:hypothetical protein